MRTCSLNLGRMSYLDPHIRLVEKEPSKLAEEIDQLRPLIEQLQKITEDIDKFHAITQLYTEPPKTGIGAATRQLMDGITHIEDALHCLKYGPDWTRSNGMKTCIDSAYLENL